MTQTNGLSSLNEAFHVEQSSIADDLESQDDALDFQPSSQDVILDPMPLNTQVLPEQMAESTKIRGKLDLSGRNTSYSATNDRLPIVDQNSSLTGALFRDTTSIGAIASNRSSRDIKSSDELGDFNFINYLKPDMIPYAAAFALDSTADEMLETEAQIRQELADENLIAAHPGKSFLLSIPVQLTDPVNLLPFGQIWKGYKAASAITRATLGASTAGFASAAIQESALQSAQVTRSTQESVFNILSAGILSGALGAGGAKLGQYRLNKAQNLKAVGEINGVMMGDRPSVGAMGVVENEDLANIPDAVKAAFKLTARNRLQVSDYPSAQKFAHDLYETNLFQTKNELGQASSIAVETESNQFRSDANTAILDMQKVYFDSVGVSGNTFKMSRAKLKNPEMSFDQYDQAVSYYFTSDTKSGNATIDSGVEVMKKLYSKWTDDLIAAGKIEAGTKPANAAAWFAQVYNQQKIIEQGGRNARGPGTFPQALFDDFKATQRDITALKESEAYKSIDREIKQLKSQSKVIHNDDYEYSEFNDTFFIGYNPGKTILPSSSISLKIENGSARVLSSVVDNKIINTGIGRNLYIRAIQEALDRNLKFVSDNIVSEAAMRVYMSLEKEGYKFKINPSAKKTEINGIKSFIVDDINSSVLELEKIPKIIKQKNNAILKKQIKELEKKRLDLATPKMKTSDGKKIRAVVDDDMLWNQVDDAVDNILGQSDGMIINPALKLLKSTTPNSLKERHILADQLSMREWHKTSMSNITNMSARALAPFLAFDKAAKAKGFKDVADWRATVENQLKNEYLAKSTGKTGTEAAKLKKEFDAIVKDINESIELVEGVYGAGMNVLGNGYARLLQQWLNYNTVRLLGGVTISSVPDIGNQVLRNGVFQSIYHGLVPMLKKITRDQSKRDLQAMGHVMETALGVRIKSFADNQSLTTFPSPWERASDAMIQNFGNLTLINQWNDLQQLWAGTVSINRTLSTIASLVEGKAVPKKDRTRLAHLGIHEKDFAYIYSQTKDSIAPNGTRTSDWTNWEVATPEQAKAQRDFVNATGKDIRSIVIEPGLGDRPTFGHTTAGKAILQFKSFGFAATNKITLASFQRRRDMEVWHGMATLLTLGAARYVISSYLRGQEPDYSFGTLAHEAIDNSGAIGILTDVWNIAQKLNLAPGESVSRYQSRGAVGAVLGPSVGLLEDIFGSVSKLGGIAKGDEFKARDLQALFRLIPFQNLFYLQGLNRIVVGKIAETFDLEDNR